ncbi:MAG: hypothetical protein ACNA8L_03930 [Luteolibacter sp.]|jgi:hypothetical protein
MSDQDATETTRKPTKRPVKRARKTAKPESPPASDPMQAAVPMQSQASDVAVESGAKRPKRRRGKKGKGGGEFQSSGEPAAQPPPAESPPPEKSHEAPQPQRHPQPTPRPPRHDPADLSRKAWKIYLAEVSEEGIALINDQEAREVARRCFRLAEVFLDEQARHS